MTHPYQVLGTSVPRMLGRRRLIEQLERQLRKPSPDHVQVVGPTLFGKSVLLSALAERLAPSATYAAAGYVDLRHAPPGDDTTFRRRFAEVVRGALAKPLPELADLVDLNDASLHELLDLCFQELEQKNARLLIVLDGFDHVLAGTGISRNLWDQLRSLAQKSSLRLVTGSRRPLRELCRTEESRTSDLWEIFYDTPIAVGPFGEEDWDELLAPLTKEGVSVDGSARKELVNWSGGVPVLAAALLERLAESSTRSVSKPEVDAIAGDMLAQPPAHLDQLWDDCEYELRADISALADSEPGGLALADLSSQRRRALESRGYAVTTGSRIRGGCRLISGYAVQQGPAAADLKRLFNKQGDYLANVGGLLELRVQHLSEMGADQRMLNYLTLAIRDIQTAPEVSLVPIRSLVQRALQLIWDRELQGSAVFPADWISEWQFGGANPKWLGPDRRIPAGDGQQMHALDLATGSRVGNNLVRRKTTALTKSTFLLLDSMRSIGDFGQHLKDYPECLPSTAFAATVIVSAIELVSGLTTDLAGSKEAGADAG